MGAFIDVKKLSIESLNNCTTVSRETLDKSLTSNWLARRISWLAKNCSALIHRIYQFIHTGGVWLDNAKIAQLKSSNAIVIPYDGLALSPPKASQPLQLKQEMIAEFNKKITDSGACFIVKSKEKKNSLAYEQEAQIQTSKWMLEETTKLQTFLNSSKQQVSEHDIVYICVGAGDVEAQIWPGFIVDALMKKRKILTILFEFDRPYSPLHAYGRLSECSEKRIPADHLNNFDMKQFLCGLPCADTKNLQDDPITDSTDGYQLVKKAHHWKNGEMVRECCEGISEYITKLVKEGKQVVLGDHRSGAIDGPLLETYNRLVKECPGQIHFLWAHEERNWFTSKSITESDLPGEMEPIPEAWLHYPRLADCKI